MKLIPQDFTIFRMNSIFIRIFFSIMSFVLLSVLLVAYISYWTSANMMINEVKSNNMLVLEQAKVSIDGEIKSIESNTMQVSLDKRMIEALYITSEDSYDQAALYRDLVTYLNSIKANDDNITDLWVYLNKSDSVVSSEGKYDSQLFFSTLCRYKSEIDWGKITSQYTGFHCAGRQEIEYDYNIPVIMFLKSLPVNDLTPKGTLVVNLSEQFLNETMGEYKNGKVVISYIVDSKNNIIYTDEASYPKNDEQKLARAALNSTLKKMKSDEGTLDVRMQGKLYTVQYVSSDANDWRYISVTPTGFIAQKANGIRNVTIWVVLLSIIMGIVLTHLLVKRLYRPVNDILNYISIMSGKTLDSQKAGSKDEFKYINRIISYVYRENENLRDSFKKSYPILKEKYLNDLANGRVSNENYKQLSSDIGIDMPFLLFQVVVFEVDEYESESTKRHKKFSFQIAPKMDEIADEALTGNARCYTLQKDDGTLVSIINANAAFYESSGINEYLNAVRRYYKKNHDLTFTIGVGRHYSGVEECSMSFVEALHALKYKIVKGQDTVIYIDEVKNIAGNSFEYRIENEKQLVTILKSGDIVAANQLLHQIFTDNLDKRSMTPEMINNLFNALVGTAIRSIYEMQTTIGRVFGEEIDIYTQMAAKSTVEEKMKYTYSICKSIALYAGERKNNQNSKVYQKIKSYVAEHYKKELSLVKVAEVVGLSPSYLSFIFKDASGMNFVDFVNEYRLEKAKELLTATSMTILQVAESVGYINANTFSKTFKRYIGISPGQFRKMK